MSFWGGKSSRCDGAPTLVRDRLLTFGAFDKISAMQAELLNAGGKRALLWLRDWVGEPCTCVKENQPKSPHSICWGTGWVGGYKKYGFVEWDIYRKADLLYGVVDPAGNYTVVPVVVGDQHTVITNWIVGTGMTGIVESVGERRNLVVSYSVDDVIWTSTLTLPVAQFKVRVIAGDEDDFEIVRVRGNNDNENDYILMSETPPRRLHEILKYGLEPGVVDIRCWTTSDPALYTGDLIHWMEGAWVGQKYVVVEKHASQLRTSNTESGTISQILGMRHVENFQQVGRIW